MAIHGILNKPQKINKILFNFLTFPSTYLPQSRYQSLKVHSIQKREDLVASMFSHGFSLHIPARPKQHPLQRTHLWSFSLPIHATWHISFEKRKNPFPECPQHNAFIGKLLTLSSGHQRSDVSYPFCVGTETFTTCNWQGNPFLWDGLSHVGLSSYENKEKCLSSHLGFGFYIVGICRNVGRGLLSLGFMPHLNVCVFLLH